LHDIVIDTDHPSFLVVPLLGDPSW